MTRKVIQSTKSYSLHSTVPPPARNLLPLPSPAHRGRGVVMGFLKVGFKKLFLLVSHLLSLILLIVWSFMSSSVSSDLKSAVI